MQRPCSTWIVSAEGSQFNRSHHKKKSWSQSTRFILSKRNGFLRKAFSFKTDKKNTLQFDKWPVRGVGAYSFESITHTQFWVEKTGIYNSEVVASRKHWWMAEDARGRWTESTMSRKPTEQEQREIRQHGFDWKWVFLSLKDLMKSTLCRASITSSSMEDERQGTNEIKSR